MEKSWAVLILFGIAITGFSQQNADSANKTKNHPEPAENKWRNTPVKGIVVRNDNKNCAVVIDVFPPGKNDTIIFLPMGRNLDTLIGSKISFNAGRLMIRNPIGCTGIPVRIWNVKKL